MADGVDIDLYADVEHEFSQDENGFGSNPNPIDLYDDMNQPSIRQSVVRQSMSNGVSRSNSLQYNYQGKKVSLYIGNLTWWTTDKDLEAAISQIGVNDLVEIKFFENRANGQSKGFAMVHFASESSSRIVLEKLSLKDIQGQNPVVTPCNRQNLNQFEQQSKAQAGSVPKPPTPAIPAATMQFNQPPPNLSGAGTLNVPPILPPTTQTSILGQPPPNTPALQFLPATLPPGTRNILNQMRPPFNVPPPRHSMMTNIPPPSIPLPSVRGMRPPNMPPPPLLRGPNVPPPSLIIPPNVNTRVPPPMVTHPSLANMPPPNILSQLGVGVVPPPTNIPPPALPTQQSSSSLVDQRQQQRERESYRSRSRTPPANDIEVEEGVTRNQAVASTAISRAVADASSGDYGSAIETLVTAISLLRQSKMAGDERTKVLIGSLRDCLHGIEDKSFGSGGGSRKRDRSHDREERPRYRESKSRRRDRERDRSRSRDRYDERDYRDRSRERERERDRDSSSSGYRHSDRRHR